MSDNRDDGQRPLDFFAEARRRNGGWIREYAPGQPNDERWFHVDELDGGISVGGGVHSSGRATLVVPEWLGGRAESRGALSEGEARIEQVLDLEVADEVLGDLEEIFERDLVRMSRDAAERQRKANIDSVERALPGYWLRRAYRRILLGATIGILVQVIWHILLSSAS